jgi:hypothetical protein
MADVESASRRIGDERCELGHALHDGGMGFLDRLLGRDSATSRQAAPASDDRAIERYRYLLQTAPPERIEQAHEEAFAQLTPEQRREVLEALAAETPESERSTADDPRSLARMATRAEMRQPGTLERSFGGRGVGMGGIFAGSMLGSIAGVFIGTAIAQQMLADDPGGDPGADESTAGEQGMESDHGGGFDGGGVDGGGFGGDMGGF